MKNLLARLSREPNLILGVVTAALSLAVLFGVNISADQMAGIGILIGSVFALVRYLTTPWQDVAAKVDPITKDAEAGPAAKVETGTPVNVQTADGRYVA